MPKCLKIFIFIFTHLRLFAALFVSEKNNVTLLTKF
jgi:hypothetical protein